MNNQDLLTSINYAIAGYLYKDGDIEDIPEILRQLADDYEVEIQSEYE